MTFYLFVLVAAIVLAMASSVRSDLSLADLLPKYGEGASRFTPIEGMWIHYRDEGAGPPLVLIHGTSSSLHTWDGWVARLAGSRRIIRLDLPGFGLTGPAPDGDYRATRYARVVATLLDRLGVDRADIAGSSLGGRVALTFALEHPARVRRLILVDSVGLSGQSPPLVFRLASTPVVNRLLRWMTPRAFVRHTVEEVYADARRVTQPTVDRYYDLTRREGNRRALIARFTGPSDPDLDEHLAKVHAPTLIAWGARDAWLPLSFAHRMHSALRDAKLVIYPDAGHLPMEELPEVTAADVEVFLAASDGELG